MLVQLSPSQESALLHMGFYLKDRMSFCGISIEFFFGYF